MFYYYSKYVFFHTELLDRCEQLDEFDESEDDLETFDDSCKKDVFMFPSNLMTPEP